jgi:hypothetical protein
MSISETGNLLREKTLIKEEKLFSANNLERVFFGAPWRFCGLHSMKPALVDFGFFLL